MITNKETRDAMVEETHKAIKMAEEKSLSEKRIGGHWQGNEWAFFYPEKDVEHHVKRFNEKLKEVFGLDTIFVDGGADDIIDTLLKEEFGDKLTENGRL